MSEGYEGRFAWRLVAALVPVGLVFAALTITGSITGVQPTKWLALGLLTIVGAVIGLRAPGRVFRHGLAAGFLAGLAAVWTQALFLHTYFANNPENASVEIPFGLTPRLATLVLGPINALLAGLVAGLLAWLTRTVSRRFGIGLRERVGHGHTKYDRLPS